MMIERYIRGLIQPLFDFIGRYLITLKVTPNSLTLFALLSGIACGICIASNQMVMALILLVVSGLCDVLDGTVARLSNTSQKIGAYMDMIGDRLVEAVIILGFAVLCPACSFAYLSFLAAMIFYTSALIAGTMIFASSGKKDAIFEQNIVARAEAFLIFGLMLLFQEYIFEILMSFNVLLAILGINRFVKVVAYDRNVKLARKKKKTLTTL